MGRKTRKPPKNIVRKRTLFPTHATDKKHGRCEVKGKKQKGGFLNRLLPMLMTLGGGGMQGGGRLKNQKGGNMFHRWYKRKCLGRNIAKKLMASF